ncbi:MAG: phosphoribosylaminoimidazolesuccinocarboxamide synthase, partial [Thermoleophilaceae bacterium]|nr:phosphoribosylaminoimidazolesuccinocarboxamide synthase [Thermoleophilaceae bacterium]
MIASTLEQLELVASGKVREMYHADGRLLMVATDRVSTYDVVHPTPVPDKGKVLAGLSAFWFERTADICPNHLISYTDVPDDARGRGLLVEELEMLPV